MNDLLHFKNVNWAAELKEPGQGHKPFASVSLDKKTGKELSNWETEQRAPKNHHNCIAADKLPPETWRCPWSLAPLRIRNVRIRNMATPWTVAKNKKGKRRRREEKKRKVGAGDQIRRRARQVGKTVWSCQRLIFLRPQVCLRRA